MACMAEPRRNCAYKDKPWLDKEDVGTFRAAGRRTLEVGNDGRRGVDCIQGVAEDTLGRRASRDIFGGNLRARRVTAHNGAKVMPGESPEDIEAVVEEEMGSGVSPDESQIRTYLQNIINADSSLVEDDDGNVMPTRQWPPRERAALLKVNRNVKGQIISFQFNDRIKAIEQLARLNGMYDDNPEHRDPFTILLETVPRAMLHELMGRLRTLAATAEPAPDDDDEADVGQVDPDLTIVSRETSIAATVAVEPDAAADADLDFV